MEQRKTTDSNKNKRRPVQTRAMIMMDRVTKRYDAGSPLALNRVYAFGSTTGTPEVCPSRSSRTRNRSTQISNAHDRDRKSVV